MKHKPWRVVQFPDIEQRRFGSAIVKVDEFGETESIENIQYIEDPRFESMSEEMFMHTFDQWIETFRHKH